MELSGDFLIFAPVKPNHIIMRKVLLSLFLTLTLGAMGQTITRTVTLKSTDLGNQKLTAVIGNDTTYVLLIKTGSIAMPQLTCALGNKEQAIHLLTFLYELNIKKGDIVDLENETHNLVTKNSLGGLLVYSEGRQFSGQLRKPNIKGFLEAIKEFTNP